MIEFQNSVQDWVSASRKVLGIMPALWGSGNINSRKKMCNDFPQNPF